MWVVNDLKLGQNPKFIFSNCRMFFFSVFVPIFIAGFKVNDIEVHIYDLAGNRKHIWEDHVSVWEVYCGFINETMTEAAESIETDGLLKKD